MSATKRENKGCLSALFGLFSKRNEDYTTYSTSEESGVNEPLPFRLRDDFLSTAEHSFFQVLRSMMGNYFTICPKVSLSDVFFVINPDKNMSAYNRINRKHVDFLICDSQTMRPRFAIELDDKSHERHDRIERDAFVDELFETAQLPLVRIPVRPAYNTNELGVLFRTALSGTQKPENVNPPSAQVTNPSSESTLSTATMGEKPIVDSKGPVTGSSSSQISQAKSGSENHTPVCPKCGQPMVLRTAGEGPNKGKRFWGCVNFPRCKVIMKIE